MCAFLDASELDKFVYEMILLSRGFAIAIHRVNERPFMQFVRFLSSCKIGLSSVSQCYAQHCDLNLNGPGFENEECIECLSGPAGDFEESDNY